MASSISRLSTSTGCSSLRPLVNKVSFLSHRALSNLLPVLKNKELSSSNIKDRSLLNITTRTISSKRSNTNRQVESKDGRWSVIAYNLSHKLAIGNAKKLLENFKEYQIIDLPHDLQHEAVMLSLKPSINTTLDTPSEESVSQVCTEPLHDIFLFREGSIVFWGVPYDQQKRVLYGLSTFRIEPYSSKLIQEEKEHMNYSLEVSEEKSKLSREVIKLAVHKDNSELNVDQFTISHAIALSVKLGIWECMLDEYITSIGWIANHMKKGKDIKMTRKQVFKKTGELYELKHCINLSSDLLDLPDIYWDRHNHEVLFLSVTSFLNLKKRTAVINEKINNCCELINLLASHINDKHHIRLEWMIIILILIEVLFEIVHFTY